MTQNTFSFRAECAVDVERFQALAESRSIRLVVEIAPAELAPDVLVEISTGASLGEVRSVLADVEDGHVMLETLRDCPLPENSLERERMRA